MWFFAHLATACKGYFYHRMCEADGRHSKHECTKRYQARPWIHDTGEYPPSSPAANTDFRRAFPTSNGWVMGSEYFSSPLPTEIILQIVTILAEDRPRSRQATLYSCCLISRQWYSVTIPFLYEEPCFIAGDAYTKFTATVSPPLSAYKRRNNLGSLVRHLDMSPLVHHSSNSVTARLLGRVRENLEIFTAPTMSFS
jgi:F-box-like